MGTDCHVILHGADDQLLEVAEAEVRRLEELWSRFRPDSEVSRLNDRSGQSVAVSAETITLVCRALRAHRLTGGWFDPFMARTIADLGYDRDFLHLIGVEAAPVGQGSYSLGDGATLRRAAPADEVVIDREARTVRLPTGFGLDPGGIGKGLAADLVSATALAAGARGALVNLGGDLRCRGEHPGDGWTITISDPVGDRPALDEWVRITEGAVATSTPLKRRWIAPDGSAAHHLLHPATGRPVDIEVASVTVIAPSGWLAEALSKALLIGGPELGSALMKLHRAAGVVVTLDGSVHRL